jgi:hypothetical protein
MTFIVRSVAIKADGSEIVRANPHSAREISIGRNGDNAVHLSDLAVNPVHATVRALDDGRVEIESAQGLKFSVDGREVHKTIVDPAAGAELGFGGHAVIIGRDEGEITLTVRRTAALSDAEEERDIGTLYTLKGLVPDKRLSAWGFALLAFAAFLAWPIWTWATYSNPAKLDAEMMRPDGFHADTMWTSGALSVAHKSLSGDCQACHVDAFVSVRDSTCLNCHEEDAHEHAPMDRLRKATAQPEGFDAFLRSVAVTFNKPPGRCVECHTEHEGAGPMQPAAQKFCADCHDGMDQRLTDTKLANAVDFGTEHPQFRPAVMISPVGDRPKTRRISLDQKPTEDNGLKFPHDVHLSKTGGVAQMGRRLAGKYEFGASLECADCHETDASGVYYQPVDMEQSCAMCHSLAFDKVGTTVRTLRHGEPEQVAADLRAYYRSTGPVRPINLGGLSRRRPGTYAANRTAADYAREVRFRPSRADAAIAQVFSEGGACYDCHKIGRTGGPVGYSVGAVHQPTRYMFKSWFNHDAHKKEDCASCHNAQQSGDAMDLLLPGIKTCRECHGGEFADAEVPSTCAMCHEYHADGGTPWLLRQQQKAKQQKRSGGTRPVAALAK